MVDTFIKMIVTFVGILGLGLGNSPSYSPPARPVATTPPATIVGEARYPAYSLWEMPFGLEMDAVAEIIEEKTGQSPERDTDFGFLTLDRADQVTMLGYPVGISAYFSSDLFSEDETETLSSFSFDLILDAAEGDAYLEIPLSAGQEEAVEELVKVTEEIIIRAQAEYDAVTETRVAVWETRNGDLENVPSPLNAQTGALDLDVLRTIFTDYQTSLIYVTFDNVELMFYTARESDEYHYSADLDYSYFDFSF